LISSSRRSRVSGLGTSLLVKSETLGFLRSNSGW
jgi:hypothetical protein